MEAKEVVALHKASKLSILLKFLPTDISYNKWSSIVMNYTVVIAYAIQNLFQLRKLARTHTNGYPIQDSWPLLGIPLLHPKETDEETDWC